MRPFTKELRESAPSRRLHLAVGTQQQQQQQQHRQPQTHSNKNQSNSNLNRWNKKKLPRRIDPATGIIAQTTQFRRNPAGIQMEFFFPNWSVSNRLNRVSKQPFFKITRVEIDELVMMAHQNSLLFEIALPFPNWSVSNRVDHVSNRNCPVPIRVDTIGQNWLKKSSFWSWVIFSN